MSGEQIKPGYKRTEVGLIPEDWNVECLGNLVKITSGVSPSIVSFTSDGYPYFKVEQLNNNDKYIGAEHTPYHFKIGPKVDGGSVVFAKRGAAIASNKVRILRDEAFMDTNLMALTPNQLLRSEYLFYSLSKTGLWQFADTTSVPQINNKHIKPLEFVCPRVDEQDLIVTALSDVDALLAKLDQLIAKKRDLKQATMQQLLTGQTRLPGFSGEWMVKRLENVGNCLRGVTYKSDSDLQSHDTAQTKRLLRSNNVQNSTIVIEDIQFVDCNRVAEQQLLRRNDILICMANGSKALVGKAGFFDIADGYDYTFGAFMGCFRVDASVSDPTFVFYLFQTPLYRDYINNLLAGSSINNLNPRSIDSLEFRMPEMVEQTAIATVLSGMDAEIACLEARLDKTRNLKQGMMQELLSGRIRFEGVAE